ncbi:hypothetical protein ALC56_03663 [Trachymyrmex septentrionalis]|uniref:Uncharacterized protein n=1 Tax=Trachymyrmex septentrionalis TaxID=34720 RepID=A0A151JZI3_9HYME|nr:hypothetical protein ALC56_03663 [Trachymyrmex septentrionalis]
MINAKTVPQNKILHRLLVDSGVHPRVLHDIMDVGRCAAWLTEFASVLEVPLISWPMSRLHARNPRSSPATHNLRQPPFSFSATSASCFPFLADSAPRHLRSSSTPCTSRVRGFGALPRWEYPLARELYCDHRYYATIPPQLVLIEDDRSHEENEAPGDGVEGPHGCHPPESPRLSAF